MSANVIVFGRPGCFYCDEAKKLNNVNQIKYEWKDVSEGDTKQELLALVPNAKTVPQIFVNGKHIGGFTEYEIYVSENMQGLGNLK